MNKAGWKTTEFWISMGTLIGGFAATMGWITPEMGENMPQFMGQIAGGAIGIVGIVMYVWSRTRVKTEETKNKAGG